MKAIEKPIWKAIDKDGGYIRELGVPIDEPPEALSTEVSRIIRIFYRLIWGLRGRKRLSFSEGALCALARAIDVSIGGELGLPIGRSAFHRVSKGEAARLRSWAQCASAPPSPSAVPIVKI